MSNKIKVAMVSLGCSKNQVDAEQMMAKIADRGYAFVAEPGMADIVLVNTCGFIQSAKEEAIGWIMELIDLKNEGRIKRIVVTGCLSERYRDQFAEEFPEIDAVVGIAEYGKIADIIDGLADFEKPSHEEGAPAVCYFGRKESHSMEGKRIISTLPHYAYLRIADGCDNCCTYCAIPAARGKVRSKKPTDVLREVRLLTENGCREIVLTGIETASYGNDLDGYGFADLLCDIDRIEGVGRVRIGSIDPSVMREDFVKKIAELHCLAPHFHISMQSGSNKILAAMKRKYNREIALRNMELLRKYIKDVNFTTDIIVGFPGETDEDFRDTVDLAEKAKFLAIHVFSYSKRAGTPAAAMKNQVPEAVKHARSAELIAVSKRLTAEILEKFISENEKVPVLFESHESGYAYGHTPSFVEVRAKSDVPLHGEIREVKPLSFSDGTVTGEITED